LILGLVLAACSGISDIDAQTAESRSQTQVELAVEQTLLANQMQTQAAETEAAVLTQNAPLPTNTLFPTNTPLPTDTSVPLFTVSPSNTALPTNTLLPTSTSLPLNTPVPTKKPAPTATKTAVVCNWAGIVKDLTVADGAIFPASSQFTKVWRLKNIGTCTWTTNYKLIFEDGKKMSGGTIALANKVAPGETIDIALPLKAPAEKGTYKGYWILTDANGKKFGIGSKANNPLLVHIQVAVDTTSFSYDFATNFSNATWKTDKSTLYPNGAPQGYKNYVQYTNLFRMETGKLEDEPAIIVNVASGERVRGIYPSYQVKAGDRFVSAIGCMYDNKDCKMKMVLSYQIKGSDVRVVLGEWMETQDGKVTLVNIELSSIVGEEVIFTLDMEAKSSAETNQVFWFLPSVRNP